MKIFNFFDEIKNKCKLEEKFIAPYTIVNVGGQIVYIEGQKGVLKLSSEQISCKLKTGYLDVKGENLFVQEITQTTLLIQGKKIYKIEVF